jgi:UDP-glucuronate 4-epimerase
LVSTCYQKKKVRASARPSRAGGLSVLVTGAAGFHAAAAGGTACSASTTSAPTTTPRSGVYVVDGDVADAARLLAAQAGVRHALVDPASYVRANVVYSS